MFIEFYEFTRRFLAAGLHEFLILGHNISHGETSNCFRMFSLCVTPCLG